MSASGTEMTPEPDWLAAIEGDRAKLTAIMAAVRRCHRQCPEGDGRYMGPHLTTTMAEVFIGQILIRSRETAGTSARREALDAARGATVLLYRQDGGTVAVVPWSELLRILGAGQR